MGPKRICHHADVAGLRRASTRFSFGEPIRFDLGHTIARPDHQPGFSTTQIYDFVVLEPTSVRVLWRWSQNMTFHQQVTQLNFDPYSSKTYSVVWDGVQNDATQLPPAPTVRAACWCSTNSWATPPS
jgi:hypothetical protein